MVLDGRQSRNWYDKMARTSPQLAWPLRIGTTANHLLTILFECRSIIHGECFPVLGHRQGAQHPDTRLALPGQSEHGVLAAMDALGRRADSGVDQPTGPNLRHAFARAGQFVERLLELSFEELNGLLHATTVQRLIAGNLHPAEFTRPADPCDFSSERSARLIIGHLGF